MRKIPIDFWNTDYNPITGWRERRNFKAKPLTKKTPDLKPLK